MSVRTSCLRTYRLTWLRTSLDDADGDSEWVISETSSWPVSRKILHDKADYNKKVIPAAIFTWCLKIRVLDIASYEHFLVNPKPDVNYPAYNVKLRHSLTACRRIEIRRTRQLHNCNERSDIFEWIWKRNSGSRARDSRTWRVTVNSFTCDLNSRDDRAASFD